MRQLSMVKRLRLKQSRLKDSCAGRIVHPFGFERRFRYPLENQETTLVDYPGPNTVGLSRSRLAR
jgi:hypothetical protein